MGHAGAAQAQGVEPLAVLLAGLDTDEELAEFFATATTEEKVAYLFNWYSFARPGQRPPPGDWRVWLLLSGRGYGKTRAGAEWVREEVEKKGKRRVALVAATAADARDVMVEGESGILAISHPEFCPVYEPSKRRLTWPNGAIATMYSADEPRRLRGPQHDACWADELASWRFPEAWDMLLFGLRLGDDPRAVVTTTPRPTRLIRELLAKDTTVVTRGTTFDNRANLAPGFFDDILAAYEGTTLGRQEIYGEVIEDLESALWHRDAIEAQRLKYSDLPDLARIVVAVDPAVTSEAGSDETGIIVAGIDGPPQRADAYVLDDLSGRFAPQVWAERAIAAYHEHHADCIVAEVNQGGDLVKTMLRMLDPSVPYKKVTATRGKYVRAEPAAALYQQGRVHHMGMFGPLEDQMCNFTVDIDRKSMGSPDRVDALVWALFELIVRHGPIRKATQRKL
jgi:phage terminase large subunit-like protein